MGSHFHSLALPGDRGDEVRASLIDWYERKGFPLSDEEPLFDDENDPDERGVRIASDERWTVVLHSHRDETERLMWELQRLGGPLLQLELHDSDFWAYTLFVDREEVERFCSNPDYFGRDHRMETDPPGGPRLRELCAPTVREADLLRIQGEKRIFADESVQRFADLIGAPAAATRYAYALDGAGDSSSPACRFQRLFFARAPERDAPPVHAAAFPKRLSPLAPYERPAMPPAVAAQMTLVQMLFWPLRLFFGLLLLIARVFHRVRPQQPAALPPSALGYRIEDGRLICDRHRFRVRLPPGAALLTRALPRPIAAFAIGDLQVTVRARRPSDVGPMLTLGADVVLDDDARYFAGEFAVRGLTTHGVIRHAKGPRTLYRQLELVATPRALYAFECSSEVAIPPKVRDAIREAVATFERW